MDTRMAHITGRTLRPLGIGIATTALVALITGAALIGCRTVPEETRPAATGDRSATEQTSPALVAEGQRIFRFDTFGDEQLWTDTLRLNGVVEKSVDPTTALAVGLKVDADVLPPGILEKGRPQEPGDHGRTAQDERHRGYPGHRGLERSHRAAWRHLRALPLHRG